MSRITRKQRRVLRKNCAAGAEQLETLPRVFTLTGKSVSYHLRNEIGIRDNPLCYRFKEVSSMPLPGIKEKLALLSQSQAQSLALIYLIKDNNSRFQFMTDLAAQHTGSSSAQELINRTASDLQCDAAEYAAELKHYSYHLFILL